MTSFFSRCFRTSLFFLPCWMKFNLCDNVKHETTLIDVYSRGKLNDLIWTIKRQLWRWMFDVKNHEIVIASKTERFSTFRASTNAEVIVYTKICCSLFMMFYWVGLSGWWSAEVYVEGTQIDRQRTEGNSKKTSVIRFTAVSECSGWY